MSIKSKCSFLTLLFTLHILSVHSIQQDFYEQNPYPDDPSMQYVTDFQNAVSNMFATESFSFVLQQGEQQKFSLWPPGDTDKVIIAFYTHNEQNPDMVTGAGFFTRCQLNGGLFQQYENKKVGAFTIELVNTRPNVLQINFRTQQMQLQVYVSYEFKKIQIQTRSTLSPASVPTLQEASKSKLSQISKKFQLVQNNSESQQSALRMVVKGLSKHSKRLEGNVKYAHYRIVLETIAVVMSGIVGMWIIKKQLNKGYELLV